MGIEILDRLTTFGLLIDRLLELGKKTGAAIPEAAKKEFKDAIPLIWGMSRTDENLLAHILYNTVDSWVREKIQALLDSMEDFQDRCFRYTTVSLFVASPAGTTKKRKEVVLDAAKNPVLDKGGKIQIIEIEDTVTAENRAVKLLNVLAAEIHASNAEAVRDRLIADGILIDESITDGFLKKFGFVIRMYDSVKKNQSSNFANLGQQAKSFREKAAAFRASRGR
jgi:hypothetical protein